jgi:hypothetical protein
MTLKNAIERFDLLYPNAMELPVKIELVSRLEGRINAELLSLYGEDDPGFSGYSPEDYSSAQLAVEFPFDDIYIKYLCAENDLVNGDTARYANSSSVFNSSYGDLAAYYSRTRRNLKNARAATGDMP